MKLSAVVGTFVVTALVQTPAMAATPSPTWSPRAETAAAASSSSAASLKQNMRKLGTDHVVWTRNYIVAASADQPDAQAAADRLMKNQEDIGNAIGAIYGAPAGQQLTTLLKEHIHHRGRSDQGCEGGR